MLKRIENYISSRILLLKVEAIEKVSDAISVVFKRIILFIIAGLVFFFASIAVAIWIGELYNSYIIGFFAIAAVYFLILIILFVFRKQLLEKNIKNDVIRTLFNDSSTQK
ncbi:MAG: phage holin family protein [Bacteroidales bacterium]|jgi:cytochrome c biogenesis protein CcdA|nr:phage holin family protein [Bacteroidales bacterium]